jgi:3-dehydroshikimate dehydratase
VQAKSLYNEFGGRHFRAAFDFANSVSIGFYAMKDWFPWLLPHLETIHIKDMKDGKVVPAGHGDGQLKATMDYLRKEGWEGVLSLEPHLQYAGERQGFSGVESFEIALRSLREVLS